MKRIRIVALAIVVPACTLVTASAQTGDQTESAVGKMGQTPSHREVAHYPTMMDMTFPEFGAAVKKSDVALLTPYRDTKLMPL